MKKYILMAAILVSGMISAQNNPKLEAFGQMVKATYYHENGQIQQQGFFKDGKLEGQWVAFDDKGNKTSMAEYSNGQKTGKWIFINETMLSEVDYANSKILSVKNWKQEAIANRN